MVKFKQAALFDVRGLRNRYRWAGIGAPLTAYIQPGEDTKDTAYSLVDTDTRVPVTMLLRFDGVIDELKRGNIQGYLELYTPDEATSVAIDEREVPLEFELSSALAYSLEGSSFYEFELLKGLLKGDLDLSVLPSPKHRTVQRRCDSFSPIHPGANSGGSDSWNQVKSGAMGRNDQRASERPDFVGKIPVLGFYL